jgi:hypothetical protein
MPPIFQGVRSAMPQMNRRIDIKSAGQANHTTGFSAKYGAQALGLINA